MFFYDFMQLWKAFLLQVFWRLVVWSEILEIKIALNLAYQVWDVGRRIEKLFLGSQQLANVINLLKDFLFFVFEFFSSSVANIHSLSVVTFGIKLFGKRDQTETDRQSDQEHSKDID